MNTMKNTITKTLIKKITDDEINNSKIIKTAVDIIAKGGLVAFPTETVYGLGGDAFDPEAAGKIYAAKGRPSDNPLIVHISEIEDMYKLSDNVTDLAIRLAEKFWPGPLTLILKKNDRVPLTVTGGLDTVAIRLPYHEIARALIKESGTFIAAPSANLSGRPSPTRAEHVIEDLNGRIDMIIDGGAIDIGLESTIVDLTEEEPVILRPGYITMDMLRELAEDVRLDRALMEGVAADVKPKAPGMKYRHYAPKAELIVIEGTREKVKNYINFKIEEAKEQGIKAGAMLSSENYDMINCDNKICIGSYTNEKEIAANLFDCLRKFDELDVNIIYSEGFSEAGIGQAIMNRLLKAAGHKVVEV